MTSQSGWTLETLKLLLEEKILSVKEALAKFEQFVLAKFVDVNEFRKALEDLGKNMATRRELEDLKEQVNALRSRVDIGPAGLQQLQSAQDFSKGKSEGIQLSWSTLLGVVALVGGLSAILARFIFP